MNIIPGTGSSVSPGAGAGGDGSPGAVLYASEQTLTDPQKARARVNIGGASSADLGAEVAARVAGDEALGAAKADKIAGGTTDNLVSRDAGGNLADSGVAKAKVVTADANLGLDEIMLGAAAGTKKGKTTGIKIAPANSAATPMEVMRGDDLRVNATGGMRLSGNTGVYAGYGAATSIAIADFDVTFVVTPRWTDMRNRQLFTQEAGGDHLAFEFGNDAGSTDMSQGAYVIWYRAGVACSAYTGYTLQQLKDRGPCVVRFTRDGAGNVTPRLNGVALTWNVTPTPYLGDVIRMFGGIVGGYGQFEGDVLRSRIANFEMTADEAAGAAKGESRGRLAKKGYANQVGAFSGTYSGTGGFTATGGGFTQAVLAIPFVAGERVRLSYTANAAVSAVRLADSSLGFVSANHATTSGSNVVEFVATAPGDRIYFDGFSGAVTVSLVTTQVSGTVADYRPGNVRRSGGWSDASLNCLDLESVAGALALNPCESYTRVIAVTVAGATVAAGAVASVGAITGATAYDTAAIAAMGQWDAVSATWAQARPANAVGLEAKVTAAGTPLIECGALTSSATVSASTAIKITHTKR